MSWTVDRGPWTADGGGRSRGHKQLSVCLALAAMSLALIACSRDDAAAFWPVQQSGGPGGAAAAELEAAPEFTLTTFEGERIALGDLEGQAVVLNFWATWCVPCRTEMPYFETTYRAYRDQGVAFLGVAVHDDPQAAQAFLSELDITYPSGPDVEDRIILGYQVLGLPTTVFIERDGTIARHWSGALSEDRLIELVEEIAT